ncbi:helix-turn-helix domain-containing protein [Listeria monocytogenes]|uniref:helix-turn-helix domain-containing protein n=1 Tax=Listeria monocytogenes TaxID=1639 RepID=UPI00107C0069|nr:helix-turn-helix transcriptional regulator [Listeria monocytogenes]EAA0139478.1 XRE family transcriptional regulator [Listeria monocytogenes]EAF2171841.1 XRE family transcriptional regulator [Listeria monocytogenes]MDA5986383.1 helix-turn-helix domain-containing protein [Listeria monocytogenes]HAA8804720.1 XRE family transcriptional regulator [Listeria monocytogenes]HAB7539279.1 helix-turn-helix domain-containing protein [Listeria monocytogenes]
MTLLDVIKKLCKKRGISVTMLENELGLPDNTIYQWKNRMPNIERLQVVADYFNVSIDYLVGRTDNPTIDTDIPPEATTLAAHIDPSATEDDMKKILEYIDFIQQKYK